MPTTMPQAMRVLLVEDNVVNQTFALALLRQRGAIVTLAETGREAVLAWAPGRFDLVLMDIQMPEMDGLEAAMIIRSREMAGQHTPIIALTARGLKGDRELCLAAGMDAYVMKPLRIRELMDTIDELTRGCTSRLAPIKAPAPIPTDVFDVERLRTNIGGDEAMLEELLVLFFSDAPMYLGTIALSAAAHDPDALANAAHAIKGSAAAIAADAMSRTAHALERAARQHELTQFAGLIDQLQSDLVELRAQVYLLGIMEAMPV